MSQEAETRHFEFLLRDEKLTSEFRLEVIKRLELRVELLSCAGQELADLATEQNDMLVRGDYQPERYGKVRREFIAAIPAWKQATA